MGLRLQIKYSMYFLMRYILLSCIVLVVFTLSAFSVHAQKRGTPESQEQIQLSFSPLVKQVSPSVVNIYTKRVVSQRVRSPFMGDPFFGRFFRDDFFGGRMRQQVENSLGSGVIIEPEGLIVTNAHVIEGAQEITVSLSDGREFSARLALADKASDLALLRIQETGLHLPYVALKPSETLEVGDLVLAIGNPFGVGQTVTSGIVSAQGRSSLDINDFNFFIQTDAAINPGNSGGPLVALDGGVVGINTAIFSRDGGSLGIGFAVPSEMVATIIAAEQMGRSGDEGVIRPWLGVSAQNVTSDIASSLGLDRPAGVLVANVHKASPLRKAEIKQGDIILAINDHNIRDAAELKFRMATVPIGGVANFKTSRNGQIKTRKVRAIAPPETPPRDTAIIESQNPLRGATVVNINPAVLDDLGIPEDEGVVVMKTARGSSSAKLVRRGDVILTMNGQDISSVRSLKKALAKKHSQGWSIVISRNGRTRQVMIR